MEGKEKLVAPADSAWFEKMFSGDCEKKRDEFISLQEGYELLQEAGDGVLGPLCKELFTGDAQGNLQARNDSIFAHGYG